MTQKLAEQMDSITKFQDNVAESKAKDPKNHVGSFGEATITDYTVFQNNNSISFELLMPDRVTTRYIQFNKNSSLLDEFFEEINTTYADLNETNIKHETIPVYRTRDQWYASFQQNMIAEDTRNKKILTVGPAGQVFPSKYNLLFHTIAFSFVAYLHHLYGSQITLFTMILLFSTAFTPALISFWKMQHMLTGFTTLSKEPNHN